jgi:NAD(P)-dependent dehydrogenase (short-subunit alcohol dehydrogenase family)
MPFPEAVAVTGGAGDIGAAIGAELAATGARVLLIDAKSHEDAEPWLARVPGATYVQADVRDRAALGRALAAFEPLEAAIGNAGIVHSAPFLEVTEQQWQEHLDVNLTGVFNLGQLAARLMVERGTPGRIVLTGSWVGAVPWPEISAYSASKAGVAMLARSMARELAPHGVLVNVVAPGIVDAGLARRQRETDPVYAARIANVIPLGRLQRAEEVARAVAFLLSAGGDYVTGTTLLADGGCSLFQFD